MAVFWQITSSMIICYQCLSMGIIYSWPSFTYKMFESNSTTLDRPMTSNELSLFGSLSSIGALISTPLSGFLVDRLGRKHTVTIFSLMFVLFWGLLAVFRQVEVVLTAIFISGLGGGVFQAVPMYTVEMCQKSIAGAMASASMILYTIGILLSYTFGGFLNYDTIVFVCLSLAAIGVLFTCALKESPVYLMKKGYEDEAVKVIAFFRSAKLNSKEVIEEITNIKRSLNPEMDDSIPEEELSLKKEKVEIESVKKLSALQFLKRSKSSRRALLVAIVLMIASIFQGIVVVQVYAEPLFSEAVPSMSSFTCSVIFALVSLVSGIIASFLLEYAGRKILMVYSSIATAIICVLLGTQIQFHWGPHALTAVFIYLMCITYMLGAGSVPYVIAAEVFLPEIKSVASTIVIEFAWLCNFIVLYIFNPLMAILGLGPLFYIFAIICFFTAIFSAILQPETKGLQVYEIQGKFANKRGNRVI